MFLIYLCSKLFKYNSSVATQNIIILYKIMNILTKKMAFVNFIMLKYLDVVI